MGIFITHPKMGHELKYLIGQTVYLRTDSEQIPRLITGIGLRPDMAVTYCLVHGTVETWHY